MSWRATSWASDQITGSPITKSVLWKLADNANDEGICWPSLETISLHTELSRRTVQEHLSRLERLGLIFIEERKTESGASLSNRYRLAMPPPASRVDKGEGAPPAPRGASRAREDAPRRTPGMQLPAPHKEPTIEPSGNRHSLAPAGAGESDGIASLGKGVEERFPEFRSAVAREWPDGFPAEDETACRRQFVAATRAHDADLVIACASLHGKAKTDQRKRRGGQSTGHMIKRPSNWLKDGDWQGYIPEAVRVAEQTANEAGALARVREAIGAGLFELLKRAGMADGSLAALDGMTHEPPAIFTITRPFQRTLVERHLSAVERHLGSAPVFMLVQGVLSA